MAQNFVESGDQITVVLGSGETSFASGKLYKIGAQVGVMLSLTRLGQTVFNNVASAEGDIAVVALEGVYEVTKDTPLVISVGDALYYNASEANLTKTAAGNTFCGFAHEAAGSSATTVKVRLWAGDSTEQGQAAVVAALAGTLTGTVDGTLADVAAIALSTSNTYTDAAVNSAVNTAITSTNLQLKELQTKLNAILTALKDAEIMASA
jgi:predicted RecA/RadA family phage recombinase